MKKRLGIAIAVLGYTLTLFSGVTHAADKPIRLVIFAAGVEPAASTPTELAALVQADRARWATLIKQKQLKME